METLSSSVAATAEKVITVCPGLPQPERQ